MLTSNQSKVMNSAGIPRRTTSNSVKRLREQLKTANK